MTKTINCIDKRGDVDERLALQVAAPKENPQPFEFAPGKALMIGVMIALDESLDDLGERRADDERDSEFDDVPAQDEILEALQHLLPLR